MSSIKKNIKEIENKIKLCKKSGQDVSLIAISKYFPKEKIQQAINAGHSIFGENKVQEAKLKWQSLKRENPQHKAASSWTLTVKQGQRCCYYIRHYTNPRFYKISKNIRVGND